MIVASYILALKNVLVLFATRYSGKLRCPATALIIYNKYWEEVFYDPLVSFQLQQQSVFICN